MAFLDQVKEKSQIRKVKRLIKKGESDIKKEARERIQREEKESIIQSELEERAIQDEMIRIREELEKEKVKKEAEMKR